MDRPPTVDRAQIQQLREQVAEAHRSIDQKTELLRNLLGSGSEALQKAEEAGAALQRLEWALERLVEATAAPQSAAASE